MITQQELKGFLDYNPETGVFTRKVSTSNSVKAGDVAGGLTSNGYVHISVGGKQHLAHRLAWLYMHGEWPDDCIDHINHSRTDNRIENLRVTSRLGNARNQKLHPTNTSGHVGVTWDRKNKKWQAQISLNHKTKKLGRFEKKEDAIKARRLADAQYGFHKNHGGCP